VIDGASLLEIRSTAWHPTRWEVKGAVEQRHGIAWQAPPWDEDRIRVFCPDGGAVYLYDTAAALSVTICPGDGPRVIELGEGEILSGLPAEGGLIAVDPSSRILAGRSLFARDQGAVWLPFHAAAWYVEGWVGEGEDRRTSGEIIATNLDLDPTRVETIGESRGGVALRRVLPEWVWRRTYAIETVELPGVETRALSTGAYDRVTVEVEGREGAKRSHNGLAPGAEIEVSKPGG
jgi:hypothetical protein